MVQPAHAVLQVTLGGASFRDNTVNSILWCGVSGEGPGVSSRIGGRREGTNTSADRESHVNMEDTGARDTPNREAREDK